MFSHPPHLFPLPPSSVSSPRLPAPSALPYGCWSQYVDLEGGPFPLSFAHEKKFGAWGSALPSGLWVVPLMMTSGLSIVQSCLDALYQVVMNITLTDNNFAGAFGTERAMEMADELSVTKKELRVFDKYGESSVAPPSLYSS
ncbi:hypothetical protein Rs2_51412 [Raphanus sativus]|nr:hypothetical protein Rs2_51412 [Raphanus sativus]